MRISFIFDTLFINDSRLPMRFEYDHVNVVLQRPTILKSGLSEAN